MLTFAKAKSLYDNEDLKNLLNSKGLKFLLLRSLSRREFLTKLADNCKIDIDGIPSRKLFEFMYDQDIDISKIKETIDEIYTEQRSVSSAKEDSLVSELYKLDSFDWGGLHQNSLEKTIVNNYVKKITSFDSINEKVDNELHLSLKGYVLCSWYNHWTSIIIEDIFKEHPKVLPAVGLVKKIDFFIADVPFDLKVTYFPEGFLSDQRKADGLRSELTELKSVAQSQNIFFDNNLSQSKLLEDLWKKVGDHPSDEAKSLIINLSEYRQELLNKSIESPIELMKWLYENQGTRRFDASNRIFLILVNEDNHFLSWQLKRAKPLLMKKIDFYWEEEEYQALAEIIYVTK